jgi:hypothetical protein
MPFIVNLASGGKTWQEQSFDAAATESFKEDTPTTFCEAA